MSAASELAELRKRVADLESDVATLRNGHTVHHHHYHGQPASLLPVAQPHGPMLHPTYYPQWSPNTSGCAANNNPGAALVNRLT